MSSRDDQKRSDGIKRQRSADGPGVPEPLLGKHGGYRELKSFRTAQLVFDLTVRFCERYINPRSRTHDQMVQAARSGVQNIAEGSEVSATSKKMELKLTQVARAGLEELKLDYEDYLRQHGLRAWGRQHPLRLALVDAQHVTADDVAEWVAQMARELAAGNGPSGPSGQRGPRGRSEPSGRNQNLTASSESSESSPSSPSSFYPELSANAILTLATVAGFLLDRQIQHLAQAFEAEGGFTERLYRVRQSRRQKG